MKEAGSLIVRRITIVFLSCFILTSRIQLVGAETLDLMAGLHRAYDSTQVLFLGTSNHVSSQSHQVLLKFLDELSADPHLRFIGLERIQDLEPAYIELSQRQVGSVELAKLMNTAEDDARFAFCGLHDEWPWFVSKLFPKLQKMNLKRKKMNPVLAIPLDGTRIHEGRRFQNDLKNDGSGVQVVSGNCSYIQFKNSKITDRSLEILTTANREKGTAKNFEKKLWINLGPNDKAIVLYHFAHLLRGFESCQAESSNGTDWVANWSHTGWIDYFLSTVPSARKEIKVLLFDEIVPSDNDSGVLLSSVKIRGKYPSSNVFVSKMSSESDPKGLKVFTPDSFMLKKYLGGQHRSSTRQSELFENVIVFSESGKGVGFPKAEEAMPEICRIQ